MTRTRVSETVTTDLRSGVLEIHIDDSPARNSLTEPTIQGLNAAFLAANRPEVRSVLLAGNADAFSAGGNRKAFGQTLKSAESTRARLHRIHSELTLPLLNIARPVVAAVTGHAAGAGVAIAMACDLRVVSSSARLVSGFEKVGLVPDFGAAILLPRLVGESRAKEFFFLRTQIDAETAREWGLVHEVVAPEEVVPRSRGIAEELARGPTVSLGLTKRLISRSFENSLEAALEIEVDLQTIATQSADQREARAALSEGRAPDFRGA